ncbi:MAG: histidine phosphatase family protein [Nocardioides sp.]
MTRLLLVRHARPLVDTTTPAHTWPLDPAGLSDLAALATSGRLPSDAVWRTSPETKAVQTARGLLGRDAEVVPGLAEHRRGTHWFDTSEEFSAAVRRAFAEPDAAAVPEWEPLTELTARVVPAVRLLLETTAGRDLVLVGHGTAWTVLVAALTGRPPDLEAWATLRMPDVWELPIGESRSSAPTI